VSLIIPIRFIFLFFFRYLKISFSDYPYAEKPDGKEAVAEHFVYRTPRFWNMDESLDDPQNKVDVEEPVPVSVSVTECQTSGLVDGHIDFYSRLNELIHAPYGNMIDAGRHVNTNFSAFNDTEQLTIDE
jgi:hypothetical protein